MVIIIHIPPDLASLPAMSTRQKAVFLDRDGVLIHDVHYLSRLEDIKIYPDVPPGLRRLKEAGYLLVVVTNQSGVARGYFPETFVSECHTAINQYLLPHEIQLDRFYHCPHHIDGNSPLNIRCECRKPSPGMVFQAQEELNINLDESYMIGDKLSDIQLAVNANLQGILLTTGQGTDACQAVAESCPDTPVFSSFLAAVKYILSGDDSD